MASTAYSKTPPSRLSSIPFLWLFFSQCVSWTRLISVALVHTSLSIMLSNILLFYLPFSWLVINDIPANLWAVCLPPCNVPHDWFPRDDHWSLTTDPWPLTPDRWLLTSCTAHQCWSRITDHTAEPHPPEPVRVDKWVRTSASHSGRSGNLKVTGSNPDLTFSNTGRVKPMNFKLVLVAS